MSRKKGPVGAIGTGGVNPAPRAEDMTVRAAAEQLISVSIDDLVPYAGNARTHSPEQIELLRRSLREFGFVAPVLIDFDNNIIAGHGRVEAARLEGMAEVPCVLVSNLSDAQRRAYILADNRLAELSGWDEGALRLEMEQLAALRFDTTLIGFDMPAPPPLQFGPADTSAEAGKRCRSRTTPGRRREQSRIRKRVEKDRRAARYSVHPAGMNLRSIEGGNENAGTETADGPDRGQGAEAPEQGRGGGAAEA